jgi:hypothetical protein
MMTSPLYWSHWWTQRIGGGSGRLVEQLPDAACGPPASRGGRVSLAGERADGPARRSRPSEFSVL